MVKTFIESLQPFCECDDNKSIGFIVQSGFGEAIHSRYVERYLKKLSTRLGCKYVGTIIRGGGEGIREMPAYMTKGLFRSFHELGRIFGEKEIFDTRIMRRLGKRDRFSLPVRLLLNLLGVIGFLDSGWNNQLKRNGVFERRYDKPYLSE
jgi:hypothetical protein